MRRDDLRVVTRHCKDSLGCDDHAQHRPVSDAEALDVIGLKAVLDWVEMLSSSELLDRIGRAAALRHWLTGECSDCSGYGGLSSEYPCQTCEGRGWVLVDWVKPLATGAVCFPLDWLGDDE